MKRKLKRWLGVVLLTLGSTFLVWRLILSYDISRALTRIRTTGLPTNGEELNTWHAEVPDNENAALVMEEAFVLIRTFRDIRTNDVFRLKLPRRGELIDSEQKQLLGDYVALNLDAIRKATEASKLSRCRYFMDHRLGANTPLPHLSKLKLMAQLLAYQAFNEGESGQLPNASSATGIIFSLAHTLDNEPVVISQLVRCAMLRMAVSSLEQRLNLGSLSANELSDLATTLTVYNQKTNLMAMALIGERAMYMPYFRMSVAEAQRNSHSDETGDEAPVQPMLPGRRSLLMSVTGFLDRDLRFYLKVMETNIAVASVPPPNNLAIQENLEQASMIARKKLFVLSSMVLPSLSRTVSKEVSSIACVRLAGAALAVEKFRNVNGRLPTQLSEISIEDFPLPPVDPFDGKPLRYRQLSKGYLIYSIDSDRRDDDGRERPERTKSSDKTSYDLTFIVER